MEKITHILVPIKGRADDEEAVRVACTIARRDKSKVSIIHVIEVDRSLPLDADMPKEVEAAEKFLVQSEDIADELGVEVSADLLQARHAGPAVVDEAADRKVDLILIGLPYKTRFGEYSLGPTASYVLRHAPCRVWLCRTALQGDETES